MKSVFLIFFNADTRFRMFLGFHCLMIPTFAFAQMVPTHTMPLVPDIKYTTSCPAATTTPQHLLKNTGIFIYGSIYDKTSKDPMNAGFRLNNKFLGYATDNGQYEINITDIADTTNIYLLQSGYALYQMSDIIIKGKIKSSIKVDIELIYGHTCTNVKELKIKGGKKVVVVKKQVDPCPKSTGDPGSI